MVFLNARRLASACIPAAAVVAALVVPGAASATLGTQCSGSTIVGQGASVESLAQTTVWDPNFNVVADKYACNGTQGSKEKPTVTYTNTGSGAGLESWGFNKHAANFGPTNAYIGTTDAPNASEKAEVEADQSIEPHLLNTLQTVPVVQAADAIIVNLPTGCTATSTSNKGRLVLDNTTLEGIFRGTINNWSEIKDGGDAISGTGCNTATPIVRVVRRDVAGTTDIIKKYLGLIYTGTFETEKGENKTWAGLAEGVENTTWPKVIAAVKPEKTGDSAVEKLVAATPGSIGYTNLAEARANGSFTPSPGTGGPKTARFWVPIQDNGVAAEGAKYADPANNKDVAALGEANCSKEEYTNGEVAFPPASVLDPWNEVTTRTTEPKYTLCGLAYVLAFADYSAYPGTSLGEATTVENFLSYVLDTNKEGGGQFLIKKHDYLPLVGTVLKEAQAGVRGVKGKGGTGF
jgi:ABC-type phosphate transport system substrate-binding protein